MFEYGSVHPKYQAVYIGSRVNITCISATILIWARNLEELLPELMVLNSIILHNVGEDDNGIYKCYGQYTNGTHFSAISDLRVGGKKNTVVFSYVWIIISISHPIILNNWCFKKL